jgi:outer membrane murein-binding lipoprotein Lpp
MRQAGAKEVGDVKKTIAMVLVLVITVSLAAVLAGCGNSEQKAKENLSTDIQQLNTDLAALLNPNTYKSLDSFQAAWTKIRSQYDKTATDATAVKSAEFADVQSSYNDLKKAVSNISSIQSLQQNIDSVLAAGTKFLTALQALNIALAPSK